MCGRNILDGIDHHLHGFDGWMQFKVVPPRALEGVYGRVVPDVGSGPAVLAELILAGRQPAGLTVRRLMNSELPLCWQQQQVVLGFA